MLHVVLLLACAVAIYVSCEWFVNAVEWLGARLRIGGIAVGTVLAAAGTALPESVVTLVAVTVGSEESGDDIAVGAAMGGPLVVGTIAYAVTGAMLLARRARHRQAAGLGSAASEEDRVDVARLARDQTWFLVIFAAKVALGLVAFAVKPWLGLLFLAAYGVYFYREMTGDGDAATSEDLDPLRLRPGTADPGLVAILAQTVGALTVIFGASQVFVEQLEWAGPALGLPTVVVALLLSPIATELPEIMNAVIWVRRGKVDLALGNISGAMMIQATVPSALGLGFTSWDFGTPAVLAGTATLLSVAYLLAVVRRGAFGGRTLLGAGLFYVAFAVGLATT